jgi:hypothetical protein
MLLQVLRTHAQARIRSTATPRRSAMWPDKELIGDAVHALSEIAIARSAG